ncbi:MAG: 4-hydroxy-tetrahydrodipicolinate reductase [Alphaproteobacteria bacterium]|nr:4-hydroxy-tetrahydrodipicolinate reductase [Alphaproteobacteria bacterium]
MARIGLLGAAGRMGQMIAKEILSGAYEGAVLAAAGEHTGSTVLGRDIGGLCGLGDYGVTISADKNAVFAACDVLIDFTTPAATMDHAALAHSTGKALVIGTTGLSTIEDAAIASAATRAAVLQAANMSVGVNVLLSVVEQLAARLGPKDFDIEIFESHHKHKVDAPSGTALALAQAAAKGRGVKLDDAMVPARYGQIGPRPEGAIGMSVFRGGDVIGDHTVTFAALGERIEIGHRASDRALFARGAVRAALWLAGKPAGRYTMRDVLGI